jgi:hypothetical protein
MSAEEKRNHMRSKIQASYKGIYLYKYDIQLIIIVPDFGKDWLTNMEVMLGQSNMLKMFVVLFL